MTGGHLKLAFDCYKITEICRNEHCEPDPPSCLAFARRRAAPVLPRESSSMFSVGTRRGSTDLHHASRAWVRRVAIRYSARSACAL